jgi:hypothetical protein
MRWAPGATTGVLVAGGDSYGDGPTELDYPIGLAVRDGFLYIADAGNDRIQRVELPGRQAGVGARVAILEPEGPCIQLQGTEIDFGSVQLGQNAVGDTNTSVTNCGSTTVALHAKVSEATGATASWEPLDADRAATCGDGTDLFSYRLSDPFGLREGLATFLDTRNLELERAFVAGATRVDQHTLFMPCAGSSGEPDEVVSMTVVFTATEA